LNFLKKHYEKLLLLIMLVLFIYTMFYVMQVAEQAKTVSDKDLALPTFKVDFEKQDPNAPQYNTQLLMRNADINWNEVQLYVDGEHYGDRCQNRNRGTVVGQWWAVIGD